jgi:hypothetical protein
MSFSASGLAINNEDCIIDTFVAFRGESRCYNKVLKTEPEGPAFLPGLLFQSAFFKP